MKIYNVLTTKCNFKQLKFLLKNSILYIIDFCLLYHVVTVTKDKHLKTLSQLHIFRIIKTLYDGTNIFLQQGDTLT